MNDRRMIKVGTETMDTHGHDKMPEHDYSKSYPECCPEPVPHQHIDTDDLRKQQNRNNHSSYRK